MLRLSRKDVSMKTIRSLAIPFFVLCFSLVTPVRAGEPTNSVPAELRQGVSCGKAAIETALTLKRVGWTYIMPQAKSPQAAWGNHDGRTTWWVGLWTNEKDKSSSAIQPKKDDSGKWVGDGKGIRFWRRGGSPPRPTEIEWLCSKSGGIPPR
jgi:hypothetical protein